MAKKIQVEMELLNKQYLQQIAKSQKRTEKATTGMAKGFSNLAKAGIGFFAARGIVSAMTSLLKVTEEQAKAEKQLDTVLKSTKNIAGLTAKEIKNMASALQEVTTFGDETIIGGQNLLLTFTKIGKDVFPQATETMLNMATVMKTDLKTQAILLGKALNDPVKGIGALNRVGVNLSEQQKKQIKDFVAVNDVASAQKVILGELETQFGGTARAATQTLGGAFQQIKNTMGDFVEDIGDEMTPALKVMVKAFGISMKSGGSLSNVFSSLGKVAGASAKFIARRFIALTIILNKVQSFIVGNERRTLKAQMNLIKFQNGIDTSTKTREAAQQLIAKGKIEQARQLIQGQIVLLRMSQKIKDLTHSEIKLKEQLVDLDTVTKTETQKINDNIKKNNALKIQGLKETTKKTKKLKTAQELYNEELKKSVNAFTTIAGQIGGLAGQLDSALNGLAENEKMRIDATYEKRKTAIKNSILSEEEKALKLASIEKRREKAKRKADRDEAIRAKTFGIIEATIATAAAVAKALPNWPLALASGLFGLAQVAVIAAQPIPSLAVGTMDVPSDTLANIHQGEIIIPKTFSEAIRSGEASLGGGGGGDIIVQGSIVDTQGLMNAVDEGRSKRAFSMGVSNYGNTGVYK